MSMLAWVGSTWDSLGWFKLLLAGLVGLRVVKLRAHGFGVWLFLVLVAWGLGWLVGG